MDFHTVFAKTERGHQEIDRRSHGLDTRHRTLLIMVDGRRSIGALGDLLGHGGEMAPMLAELETLGLVAKARDEPRAQAPRNTNTAQDAGRLADILRSMAETSRNPPVAPPQGRVEGRLTGPGLLDRCRFLVTEVASRARQA